MRSCFHFLGWLEIPRFCPEIPEYPVCCSWIIWSVLEPHFMGELCCNIDSGHLRSIHGVKQDISALAEFWGPFNWFYKSMQDWDGWWQHWCIDSLFTPKAYLFFTFILVCCLKQDVRWIVLNLICSPLIKQVSLLSANCIHTALLTYRMQMSG